MSHNQNAPPNMPSYRNHDMTKEDHGKPVLRSQHLEKRRVHTWPSPTSPHQGPTTTRYVSDEPILSSARFVGHNGLSPTHSATTTAHHHKQPTEIRPDSKSHSEPRNVLQDNLVPRKWHVSTLKSIPTYHPLEKSAVTVHNVPLHLLCSRISDFMRLNSICCTYHGDRVDGFTMGLVKFAVQLWNGREGGIVIEVQRRQGCCIEMQHIRHDLVQAVTTGEIPTVSLEEKCLISQASCRTLCAMKKNMNSCQEADALKITIRLLQSDHSDQNRLGMESLIAMTNPNVVNATEVINVCHALVYGQGRHAECLREALLRYFVDTDRGIEPFESLDYDSDADEDELEYRKGSHFGEMHNLALRVLANALCGVKEHGENHDSSVDLQSPFWTQVCQALVYNVEVASHRPREAALSAKCLHLLSQTAPETCELPIVEDRLLPVLIDANEYGRACHLSLERESQRLMGRLAEVR